MQFYSKVIAFNKIKTLCHACAFWSYNFVIMIAVTIIAKTVAFCIITAHSHMTSFVVLWGKAEPHSLSIEKFAKISTFSKSDLRLKFCGQKTVGQNEKIFNPIFNRIMARGIPRIFLLWHLKPIFVSDSTAFRKCL